MAVELNIGDFASSNRWEPIAHDYIITYGVNIFREYAFTVV